MVTRKEMRPPPIGARSRRGSRTSDACTRKWVADTHSKGASSDPSQNRPGRTIDRPELRGVGEFGMSMDRSLKSKAALTRHRNVLSRAERIKLLTDEERWGDGK